MIKILLTRIKEVVKCQKQKTKTDKRREMNKRSQNMKKKIQKKQNIFYQFSRVLQNTNSLEQSRQIQKSQIFIYKYQEVRMSTIFDCYEILHIEPSCSDLQVRKAYRKMAKLKHPDKIDSELGVSQEFCHINEAYKKIISFRKKYPIFNEPVQKQFSRQCERHEQFFEEYEKTFKNHLETIKIVELMLKQISTKKSDEKGNQSLTRY